MRRQMKCTWTAGNLVRDPEGHASPRSICYDALKSRPRGTCTQLSVPNGQLRCNTAPTACHRAGLASQLLSGSGLASLRSIGFRKYFQAWLRLKNPKRQKREISRPYRSFRAKDWREHRALNVETRSLLWALNSPLALVSSQFIAHNGPSVNLSRAELGPKLWPTLIGSIAVAMTGGMQMQQSGLRVRPKNSEFQV